jgi:thymidylate kinase
VIPGLLERLLATLKSEGIVFCHWKSNLYFKDSAGKNRDLDILVSRQHSQAFETALLSLGFRHAIDRMQVRVPAVLHFYGLDRATGTLVHLHVYYRVITGESLLKNYAFPVEGMLLQALRIEDGMPMPQRAAELLILVLRIMLKYKSPIEYLLLKRGERVSYEVVCDEIEALKEHDTKVRCRNLLAQWLPSVEPGLFFECLEALRGKASIFRRVWLAFRLHGQLRIYDRLSFMSAALLRTGFLVRLLFHRLRGGGKCKQLVSGGRLIAFVGPEATGKSTLVNKTVRWLGNSFDVKSAHLGKPPSTWLTFLPNLALRSWRRATGANGGGPVTEDSHPFLMKSSLGSVLYALRAVMVAWDRRSLAVRMSRKVINGSIVICDRYPAAIAGAMDGPRLEASTGPGSSGRLVSYLRKVELNLYRQVSSPDVVIRLTVPVEVAITRNKERQWKREPDDYVRRRHVSGVVPSFPTARSIELDSNQPLSETILSAREIVWDAL